MANPKSLKSMVDMCKGARNPNALIQSLIQQNPQMMSIMPLLNNTNPKQAFMQQAKQMGVDPQQVINMLKN